MKRQLISLLLVLAATATAQAEVKTKTVNYQHGETTLKGFLAWDDSIKGKRPGVMIVHEWWGLNDFVRQRAERLAKMGYVAFAVDMYGDGKVTEHPKTASKWAMMIRENTKNWQARALAGLKILKDFELTDSSKLAATGYCFGGSTVLHLAYADVGLNAVVSFHGSPVTPPAGTKQVKTKILFCHGAEDKFIPDEKIAEMRTALDKINADYQIIYYANATHSFTVPEADQYTEVMGIRYEEN